MRLAGVFIVFGALALIGMVPRAAAQSQYCLPLQMELAELERSSPGSTRSDPALRRELDAARDDERRAGCRSFFARGRSASNCRAIRSRISQLERQLYGGRDGFFSFGRSPLERRRDRIRQELARAGCSTYASTYRTICVRLCDGYYFPLSHTASRQRFAQDAAKCTSQYPPGEAVLFYHPFPNGDASQAVSLNGERYFDQQYAFVFRSQFLPYCAAQLHTGLAALRERLTAANPQLLGEQFEAAAAARMATPSVPTPIARPDWSSDPETQANRAGALSPTPVVRQKRATVVAGRAMRTVGDPYYFAKTNPGPPPTVAGYKPPELKDFRIPQRATMLPGRR